MAKHRKPESSGHGPFLVIGMVALAVLAGVIFSTVDRRTPHEKFLDAVHDPVLVTHNADYELINLGEQLCSYPQSSRQILATLPEVARRANADPGKLGIFWMAANTNLCPAKQ